MFVLAKGNRHTSINKRDHNITILKILQKKRKTNKQTKKKIIKIQMVNRKTYKRTLERNIYIPSALMPTRLIPSSLRNCKAILTFSDFCGCPFTTLLYFGNFFDEIISNKLMRSNPSLRSVARSSTLSFLSER